MPYRSPTTAMSHQVNAREAAYRAPAKPCPSDAFAYLMDMGTGKSKVIIDEWGEDTTNGGAQDLLVVAPAGSYKNWYRDKSELHRSEFNVHLDPEVRERTLVAGWTSGGGTGFKNQMQSFLETVDPRRPRALVMNVEALSSVDAARELATEFLNQRTSFFAVDESTIIKNPAAKRTKWITRLGENADVKRIATGLLTPRSPMDAFAQFRFLDWRILGYESYYSFRARYAVVKKMEMQGRMVDHIVAFRNLDELQEKIARYSFRVLKEDCLDLKPKVFLTRDVKHTPEQAKAYRELRANATTQINSGHVTVETVIGMMIRLHQINLGFVTDEDGNTQYLPENRTDGIMEALDEHRGKAVIWTPFIPRLHMLENRFKKEFGPKSIALWYGGNVKSRHEDEARFLGDPDCKYMIATQGAGMRGNTWVNANLNIYDSNTHDLEQRQQSEDRTHRKGQTGSVTYVDMITEDTVDIKFVTSLRRKYSMATQITGENMRDWI